jgi:hypothetical protein
VIVDIYNQLFTILDTDLVGINVETSYNNYEGDYPLVTLEESSNNGVLDTFDSGGERHNEIDFEINIFTIGSTRRSEAMEIRSQIDEIMTGELGMFRILSNPVPNFGDRNIYRYVLRYNCEVDVNKQIFRR